MAENTRQISPPGNGTSFRFGSKLNARRPGVVTALEFDGEVLHLVQTAPKGEGAAINRVVNARLDLKDKKQAADPAALGKAIAQALEAVRWKPGLLVMGVRRQAVVVRTLIVPDTPDIRETASMVQMQIGKDLPFRQEDAVIDFQVRSIFATPVQPEPPRKADGESQPDKAGAKSDVLAAAVKRDTVQFYQTVAAECGAKLVALGWISQGSARALQACGFIQDEAVVALVTLRRNEIGIDVVTKEGLLFSRGAALSESEAESSGEQDERVPASAAEQKPGDSATLVERFAIEVVRTLHAYGGALPQRPVTQLVVIGQTGEETAALGELQKRLEIPCALLDPKQRLELPADSRDAANGALGAIGLGLGINDATGLPIDFLSPKRPAVQRDMRRIRTLALTAAGVALLMAFLGFRSHLINKRLKINKEVQRELAQAEKQMPVYRRMQQQAAAIQAWSKDGRNWLEQYAYLSSVLPGSEEIYITALSVSGQGNIHLGVQARSGETLANLDRQLRAAGYEVKPLAITPGNDRYGYNFRSSVELLLPAKMKVDLAKVPAPTRPADDASLEPKARGGRKGARP